MGFEALAAECSHLRPCAPSGAGGGRREDGHEDETSGGHRDVLREEAGLPTAGSNHDTRGPRAGLGSLAVRYCRHTIRRAFVAAASLSCRLYGRGVGRRVACMCVCTYSHRAAGQRGYTLGPFRGQRGVCGCKVPCETQCETCGLRRCAVRTAQPAAEQRSHCRVSGDCVTGVWSDVTNFTRTDGRPGDGSGIGINLVGRARARAFHTHLAFS